MHRLFQFSPPRGGRPFRFISATPKSIFQFSPPRGGRLHGVVIVFGHLLISILAPARGATDITTSKVVRFQFQFPPPHGGRPRGTGPLCRWKANFNSRPRTGGDFIRRALIARSILFQFPPPHGGRPCEYRSRLLPASISIPAPARGATVILLGFLLILLFQFPPPHGGRLVQNPIQRMLTTFQFPPPHGGRLQRPLPLESRRYFNSRPRTGGDTSNQN